MVYLVHFSGKLGNARHSAQHYVGSTPDGRLDERLAEHRTGQGARITAAAVERGYDLRVVRTWSGGRKDERRLKRAGHFAERLCPECRSHHATGDGHAA